MSCPLSDIAERAALGVALSKDEASRLSDHDVAACDDCSTLTTKTEELDGLLGSAFGRVGEVFDRRQQQSIDQITAQIDSLELATPRHLRRLNWRFVFYATMLAGMLLLSLNFTALLAILRLQRQDRQATARTEVRTLTIALFTYGKDNPGGLPADLRGVVQVLSSQRPDRPDDIYFRFDRRRLGPEGYFDPWGRAYRYLKTVEGFRVWSLGRDGEGGEDIESSLVDAVGPRRH